jgi:glycosyltransferase involved in cell wall biosynthesis
MNVLFLSSWFPHPPDNGAKIRILNLLRVLSQQHRVTLIAASDPSTHSQTSGSELETLCEHIYAVPGRPRPPRGMRRILSFARPVPEWVLWDPLPAMRRAIAREVGSGRYEVIVAYELGTAIYAQDFGSLPALLEDVELGGYQSAFSPDRPILRRWRGRLFWWKLQRAVPPLLKRFSAGTVVSETEQQLLESMAPYFGPIEIIPNCLDYNSYQTIQATPQPGTLVFSGSLTFSANYEAMAFFLREIYPLIRLELPDVRLCITGKHDNLPLPIDPSDSQVTLTGYVDDVRPLIAGSWVSIVPLLTGGGTRLKILEAMALGTPVVSTTKGAEGLAVESGRHLLIADRPEDFAAAVVRICREADLREQLAAEARCLVAERYDWSAVRPRFLQLVERVANQPPLGQETRYAPVLGSFRKGE